ncbi:hypothetical protein KBY93_03705 [Synechococcus sp. J7-Johnson]|uniref:hypothetical protein n=1 Tax=Synechococcus sp. J7-Johnson TaxID=2823737 RepID=UPI0020CD5F3F|nr:hypothetical protein [Synechococcus sp. J7-Johnson]MCP9839740.1 hypothetical protein [Synechococcus sp. J7-Johnson]
MPLLSAPAPSSALLAIFTFQEWMLSGGLIEISLVLAALLGAVWLVSRRAE